MPRSLFSIDSSSSGSSFIWDPNMQTTNILVIMYHLSLQIRLSWMFFRIIFVISLVVHRHSSRATTSTGATFGPASGTIFTSCCLTRMGGKGKSRVRCRKQLWRQDWCTMTHRDTQGYPLWRKERPAYILWSRLVFYRGQRRFDSPGSAILIMLTGPVAGSGYSGYWCWWRDNWCQHVSAQFKFGKVHIWGGFCRTEWDFELCFCMRRCRSQTSIGYFQGSVFVTFRAKHFLKSMFFFTATWTVFWDDDRSTCCILICWRPRSHMWLLW